MSSDSKQESRREIAEQIAEAYRTRFVFPALAVVNLTDAIEAALKERDERAVRIIREHREGDVCKDNCWTTITAAIRNEEPHA